MTWTISCPNCSSRYLLPGHLLGPGGARVTCPACWHRFVVDGSGAVVPLPPVLGPAHVSREEDAVVPTPPAAEGMGAAGSAASTGAAGDTGEPALAAAHRALEPLDARAAELLAAAGRDRLFSEFGPALLDAFDRFRAEAGESPEPFRRAARERWRLELPVAAA